MIGIIDNMKRKVIGQYFNLDLTQKVNFEHTGKDTLRRKNNQSRLTKYEIRQCRFNNRTKVIQKSLYKSNRLLLNILNKGN